MKMPIIIKFNNDSMLKIFAENFEYVPVCNCWCVVNDKRYAYFSGKDVKYIGHEHVLKERT